MAAISLAPAESFRQKMQQALMQNAFDASPIQSPWQGASRMAQALMLGLEGADEERQNKGAAEYTAKFLGGALGGGAAPGGVSAMPASPQPAPVSNFGDAIAGIESGGKYDAMGPVTKTGDRAFGKYQIMGANIGPWSQAALGQQLTPEQFLADPKAQDAVFQSKFGEYVKKYGPEGAARAWFAGEGGMNNPDAKDQLGTSVGGYAQKFMQALGGPQMAAGGQGGAPMPQMAQAAPAPAMAPQGAMPSPLANVPPQQRQMLLQGLQSSNPRIRAQAAALAQQYLKPPEYKKLNDDTLFDERTGRTLPVGPGYHPLVDPAERAKFGIPAEDKRPYQIGPGNKLINPPAENRISMNTVANPIISGIGEQFTKAREAANAASKSVPLIHEARKMLDEGAITGAAAPFRVQMQKIGSLMGMSADEASNAEVFRATIGNQVLANIKSLGANPSNADRDYIEKVAGGQIQLEEKSLRRILDINEKYARKSIDDFNRDSKKLMDANPDAYRGVSPLMQIEMPAEYKPAVKRPSPADIENEMRRRGLLK